MTVTYPQIGYEARAIEDALHTWLAETSGVGEDRTWWENFDVVEVEYPFATLNWLSETPIGMPANGLEVLVTDANLIGTNDPRADVRLYSGQPMAVTISVQVFCDPRGAPEGTATRRLSAAIARLQLQHRATLNALGLAILSISGITQPNAGQALCELSCLVASNVYEDINSIQAVAITPTISGNELAETIIVNPEIGSLSYNSSMNYNQPEFTYEG